MIVFVIDDNREMLHIQAENTKRALPTATIKKFLVSSYAISCISEYKPDLIVTDFMMPEKNGDAVLDASRAFNPKVPVVLVSGMPSDSKKLKEYNDWFYKDYDRENFTDSLRRLMNYDTTVPQVNQASSTDL